MGALNIRMGTWGIINTISYYNIRGLNNQTRLWGYKYYTRITITIVRNPPNIVWVIL